MATAFLPNDAVDSLPVGDNPRQWHPARRWGIVVLVSVFCLISPMSSSMVAPALQDIAHDTSITAAFTKQLILSIFVLTYGIIPIVLGPLSEMYGRIPILQLGNSVYIVFNTACGVSRTPAQILAFRAISGAGAGAPLAIGAAMIGDLFTHERRGKAIAVYNMAPVLGPSLGPILGAAVTQYISWPWIFYITSGIDAVVLAASFFILRETYLPLLQERRRRKSARQTSSASSPAWSVGLVSATKSLAGSFARPFRMLAIQPVIQLLAIYVAYLYGIMYLVLSTFPTLWTTRYGESTFDGGLNYIALGSGYVIGSQICALSVDRIYVRLKRGNHDIGVPEFRLPLAMFSACLVPIGLLVYGWSAQYRIYWLLPDVGCALFSMGVIIGLQCNTGYLTDAFPKYRASASGAVLLLRGFAGFGFPLAGPDMYQRMGYGWANTLLAFIAIIIGIAAPVAVWFFGARLRARSGLSNSSEE